MRPKGSGAAGASAALALLDDDTASPALRRLASAPAALGTRPIVLSPRAASAIARLFPSPLGFGTLHPLLFHLVAILASVFHIFDVLFLFFINELANVP
jgi:hypothetical protein